MCEELISCHETEIVFSEHSDAISSEIVNILESKNLGAKVVAVELWTVYCQLHFTFKQQGWYLNSSAWFMKHILFEQKKIKFEINGILWKIKTHYAACLKNAVNFLIATIYQIDYWGHFFMCVHMCRCVSFKGALNMEKVPVTSLVPE
jgi:hypothetical protein